MNQFDWQIIHYLNSFAHRSWLFDKSMGCIEANVLFKGGLIVTILWWLWFSKQNDENTRENVLSTIILSLLSISVARSLALLLPFRSRPIYNAGISFNIPFGTDPGDLESWSSFPSDHAVFFFTLATGIFLISRYLGFFVYLYSLVFICFPRVYLGYHSPTDIIAGALLGIAVGSMIHSEKIRKFLTGRLLIWEREKAGAFYAAFFFVSYQMVILFDPIRDLGHRSLVVFKHFGAGF